MGETTKRNCTVSLTATPWRFMPPMLLARSNGQFRITLLSEAGKDGGDSSLHEPDPVDNVGYAHEYGRHAAVDRLGQPIQPPLVRCPAVAPGGQGELWVRPSFAKQPTHETGATSSVNDQRNDNQILVVPVVNRVGEWIDQNAPEILVNQSVNLAILLNVGQAGIEDGQKTIA
jgi:hypothetical protein